MEEVKMSKTTNKAKGMQWKKPIILTISAKQLSQHIQAAAYSGGACGGGVVR